MKEEKTIEERAKDCLKNNKRSKGQGLEDAIIEAMIDFYKQELKRVIPSDEEIEKQYPGRNGKLCYNIARAEAVKRLKQQILKNIK